MRTFSFEGTKVAVAAAILSEWGKFPVEEKVAFIDAAYERQISNARTEDVIWRPDPGKLRNAAKTHKRIARALFAWADSIESPPGDIRAFTELRRILVSNWAPPEGICLCWMSYTALAKFLRLTCPGIPVHSVAALEKECQRLGLPKLPHPLVQESQIRLSDKGVHLAG